MEYTVEIRLDGELSERQIYFLLDTFKGWGPAVCRRELVFSLDAEQMGGYGKTARLSPARAIKLVLGRWIAQTGDRGDYPEVEAVRVIAELTEGES